MDFLNDRRIVLALAGGALALLAGMGIAVGLMARGDDDEAPAPPPVVAPETIESPIVAAPFEAPTIAAPIAASAAAVEVEPEDAAFHEAGVEITRLAPGEPQEIIVPLEVATPFGPRLFRLTLRLEIKP